MPKPIAGRRDRWDFRFPRLGTLKEQERRSCVQREKQSHHVRGPGECGPEGCSTGSRAAQLEQNMEVITGNYWREVDSNSIRGLEDRQWPRETVLPKAH